MTDTQPFMDEAANLFWQIAKDAPAEDENGDACWSVSIASEIIATALSAAYQRGREEERAEQDRRTEEYPKRWAERHSAIRTQRDKG